MHAVLPLMFWYHGDAKESLLNPKLHVTLLRRAVRSHSLPRQVRGVFSHLVLLFGRHGGFGVQFFGLCQGRLFGSQRHVLFPRLVYLQGAAQLFGFLPFGCQQ